MPGFPLLTVYPHLLERVITKVGAQTYFRLQRTNHEMNGFIRGNLHISVHLPEGRFSLNSSDITRDDVARPAETSTITLDENIEEETLYGIRLSSLCVHEGADFEDSCSTLSKNRITCNKLKIETKRETWTKEQCLVLLKILKPVEVDMSSLQSDRYEALWQVKTIKRVDVDINPNNLGAAMTQMFSAIPRISVSLQPTSSVPYHAIFKILSSNVFPLLEKFMLFQCGMGSLPSAEGFLEEMRGIPLTITERVEGKMSADVHLPRERSHRIMCFIFIHEGTSTGMFYRRMPREHRF